MATPSAYQSLEGGLEAITRALEQGADPNEKREGKTLLDWAVTREYRNLVQVLLRFGADPNLANDPDPSDNDRFSRPLFGVARNDANREMLEILLKAGADANLTDDQGITPLMSAAMRGAIGNMRLLVEAGADAKALTDDDQDALSFALQGDYPDVVVFLLELGLDPTRRPNGQESALDEAKRRNFTRTLAVLHERGF